MGHLTSLMRYDLQNEQTASFPMTHVYARETNLGLHTEAIRLRTRIERVHQVDTWRKQLCGNGIVQQDFHKHGEFDDREYRCHQSEGGLNVIATACSLSREQWHYRGATHT